MQTKKILIVDDEPMNRMIISAYVDDIDDYEVEAVELEDGQECIEYLQSHDDVDLIILDQMMPRMDGLSVCQEMVKQHYDIPVIFCTAHQHMAEIIEEKCNHTKMLNKPFDVELFYEFVYGMFEKYVGD